MSDYEYLRQKYASLEAQYFALVKAIADGLAMQTPPRFVVSKDFTMPVEVAGSLEPGAMQMLVPSESVQFPAALPIDMVLHCPKCHLQHIDAPESPKRTAAANSLAGVPAGGLWNNPPHRSHLCSGCGWVWRPADVCTNGVAAVKTVGKNDRPIDIGPEINVEAEQLALIGRWDHRGDSVAEAADEHFGAGAWARLLKRIRR